jgi:hypothetical protein
MRRKSSIGELGTGDRPNWETTETAMGKTEIADSARYGNANRLANTPSSNRARSALRREVSQLVSQGRRVRLARKAFIIHQRIFQIRVGSFRPFVRKFTEQLQLGKCNRHLVRDFSVIFWVAL